MASIQSESAGEAPALAESDLSARPRSTRSSPVKACKVAGRRRASQKNGIDPPQLPGIFKNASSDKGKQKAKVEQDEEHCSSDSDETIRASSFAQASAAESATTTTGASASQPPSSAPNPIQEETSAPPLPDGSTATSPTPAGPAEPPFNSGSVGARVRCHLPSCRKSASCRNRFIVYCPACGPSASVRYCRRAHLYADIRRHHAIECCTLAITRPIDAATTQPKHHPPRPYMALRPPSSHDALSHLGTVERHRQAVYFASESSREYFLFNDVHTLNFPGGLVNRVDHEAVRGRGPLVHTVHISENSFSDTRRARFRYDLLQCLAFGVTDVAREQAMVRVVAAIRLSLLNAGKWNNDTINLLAMQIGFEFAFRIPGEMLREVEE